MRKKAFCKNFNKMCHKIYECRNKNIRPNFWRTHRKERNTIKSYNCGLMWHSINQCRVKKCKYCQKFGHLEETCWSKNDKPQRNVVNNEGKIKCYNCGKYGHMARSCLNKTDKSILKRVNFNDEARINHMSWEDMDQLKVKLE